MLMRENLLSKQTTSLTFDGHTQFQLVVFLFFCFTFRRRKSWRAAFIAQALCDVILILVFLGRFVIQHVIDADRPIQYL